MLRIHGYVDPLLNDSEKSLLNHIDFVSGDLWQAFHDDKKWIVVVCSETPNLLCVILWFFFILLLFLFLLVFLLVCAELVNVDEVENEVHVNNHEQVVLHVHYFVHKRVFS